MRAIYRWRNGHAVRRLYFEWGMEGFYDPVALRKGRQDDARRRAEGVREDK